MTFTSALGSVGALLVSCFFLLGGNSLQFVILSLRGDEAGFSLAAIGAMTGSYYIGYALGSLYAPGIVDRIGHIRVFAAAASLTSGIVLAHGLFVDATFWVVLRLLTGLCFAGIATVVESWVNARATRNIRARLLGALTIVVTVGYACGPLAVIVAPVSELTLFALASILMSVALLPVTLTRYDAPAVRGRPQTAPQSPDLLRDVSDKKAYSVLRLWRETPLGAVGCFLTGGAQGAFLGLGAVYASRVGLDNAGSSTFVTAALLSGALAQVPLGWLADRFDRRSVFTGTVIAIGVACLALAHAPQVASLFGLALAPEDPAAIALAAIVAGVAAMPVYPIVIAYVNDRVPEDSIIPAAAAMILMFAAGSAIAGPLVSLAMEWRGPSGLYDVVGVMMLTLGAFGLARIAIREAPEPSAEGDGVYATPGFAPLDVSIEHAPGSQGATVDPGEGKPATGSAI